MATVPTPVHPDRATHRVRLVVLVVVALAAAALVIQYDWDFISGTSTGLSGSGIGATQTRDLTPFTRLELAGANNVTVHVGSPQAVAVHADDNLVNRVTTEVHDGTLVIANRGSFTTKVSMSVDVTVPALDRISLSGSGVLQVGGVQAEQLTIRVPGSGTVKVSGAADRLEADLAGTGDVQLGALIARDVRAIVSGTGRLEVHATESLDASVSGVGAIVYSGNPDQLIRNVTGTGSITEA